jgi:hypothetical protein
MMSVAALFELVTLIAFFMLITGGKQKRERGWRLLSFLLVLVGLLQCASMAVVVCTLVHFHKMFWDALLILVHRPTSSITMIGSLLGGSCPKVGFCARLAGLSACSLQDQSVHQRTSCHLRVAMKLYQVNAINDDLLSLYRRVVFVLPGGGGGGGEKKKLFLI